MEMEHSDKVYAFDTLFTTNHIQMLKVIASYLQPPVRSRLTVYIKFLELNYTLRFFANSPQAALSVKTEQQSIPSSGLLPANISILLDELLPYCSLLEREKIQNFKNIFQSMENIQETMQLFEMMKDISPEFFGSSVQDAQASDKADGSNVSSGNFMSGINWQDFSQMMDMMQSLQSSHKKEG